MIKIYYNNKTLFLSEPKIPDFDNDTKIAFSDEKLFINFIKSFIYDDRSLEYSVYGASPKKMLQVIKTNFDFIIAAGGLLRNRKNEILFIYKRKKWDLPKGKIEKGENPVDTAKREISEECGIEINSIKIIKKIINTYHIYIEDNTPVLKKTTWFESLFTGNDKNIKPQQEEGIEIVCWVKKSQLPTVLENSYRSVVDVLN